MTSTSKAPEEIVADSAPGEASDFNTKIIEEFRANQGRVGGPWAGTTLILIHHIGARSGTERVTPLGRSLLEVQALYDTFFDDGRPDQPGAHRRGRRARDAGQCPGPAVPLGQHHHGPCAADGGRRDWPCLQRCCALTPGCGIHELTGARRKEGQNLCPDAGTPRQHPFARRGQLRAGAGNVRPLRRADISGTRTLSRQDRDPRLGRDAFPCLPGPGAGSRPSSDAILSTGRDGGRGRSTLRLPGR